MKNILGYAEGLRVFFGEHEATDVRYCSASLLKCIAPSAEMRGMLERTVAVRLMSHAGAADGEISHDDAPAQPLVSFTYIGFEADGGVIGLGASAADGMHDQPGARADNRVGFGSGDAARKRQLECILERIDDSLSSSHELWGVTGARPPASGVPLAFLPPPVLHQWLDTRDADGRGVLHHLASMGDHVALAALLSRAASLVGRR